MELGQPLPESVQRRLEQRAEELGYENSDDLLAEIESAYDSTP
jgi:hypothetical protein